jgi:two-component system, chemotaxis family, chemotaxis protein CheY
LNNDIHPNNREESRVARVLVVDDAMFMRKVVSDALTSGGHEVIGEAANGQEAVDRFKELRPDVMTLDITMPEMDGIAALREIIALDPAARVVMCSAIGQETKVLEAVKTGAKDFIVKPFATERVLSAIDKAMS